ncbi:DUF6786 family protein [Algibacter sp. 2305UL17-15]|uniref:DUF6786 family protein n=1 Tax=Algibacter sp. 2305UL17-15 TaxID=3231268 RepID=UPI003457DA2C
MMKIPLAFILILCFFGCCSPSEHSYQNLLNTIKSQTEVVELISNNGKARLMVSPFHQGKILASTYDGLDGDYNGWINTIALADTISKNKNIGGEERLWLGPLGSQFSFYYQQIKPISDANWKVPETIDAEPYQLVAIEKDVVSLTKNMRLTNFVGTIFNLKIDRTITLFNSEAIKQNLNIDFDSSMNFVAFETKNTLTNTDSIPWTKNTGLIGLWSAGMYKGTDDSVVIIPLQHQGNLDNIYTYFGTLDETRLLLKENTLLFKGDGKYKTKIGIPPQFAPNMYGCYTKSKNRLTIVEYKKENDSLYSNSFISIQDEPYKGEAIPIYNNNKDFFELESNAALKEMQPNETDTHWHRVYHFSGSETELSEIANALLGIDLEDCEFKE